MAIATYSYVLVKELVAKAKINCGIYNGTLRDTDFKYWIQEAANEMCTALEYKEYTATLPICDHSAKLPCEFVKFDKPHPIAFTSSGLEKSTDWIANWRVTYTGGAFVTCSPINQTSTILGVPTIMVQNGEILFSNNIDATEVTISYLGLYVNDDGVPYIPEKNARPIIAYACYMYHLTGLSADNIIERWNRLWTNGKLQRRAASKIPDSLQKEQISRIMNTLL